MTNYKLYTITSKSKPASSCVRFILNDYVVYVGGKHAVVDCLNAYPFNTYEVGDYIEIDNDRTRFFSDHSQNLGSDVVRKVSSSEVVPSSSTDMVVGSTTITRENYLAIARGLDEMVEQSGGRNEYTAHIEVRDNQNRPIKFSLSSKRANN